MSAFAAAVYLRWIIVCDHDCGPTLGVYVKYQVRLLCAKTRVTQMNGLTLPRSELNSLLLSSRLFLTTSRSLSSESSLKPTVYYPLSDSECSISALEKSTLALKPYFHNRVSEIMENII